jgi:hypothetical protein
VLLQARGLALEAVVAELALRHARHAAPSAGGSTLA